MLAQNPQLRELDQRRDVAVGVLETGVVDPVEEELDGARGEVGEVDLLHVLFGVDLTKGGGDGEEFAAVEDEHAALFVWSWGIENETDDLVAILLLLVGDITFAV